MERRHFLKLACSAVIGATALALTANAAPLSFVLPQPGLALRRGEGVEPAVVTQDDVDHLKPEQVHWRHRWHRRWHWRRRHWHRRYWRRHWAWRRHHWRHRHWRRHHW
jgi:hypothetical protein